jgi:hypothetical protein
MHYQHKSPGQGHNSNPGVEVLATYSHTVQAADLQIWVLTATRNQRPET